MTKIKHKLNDVINQLNKPNNLFIHQWTLNGLTYPFVQELLVASLPHPKPSEIELGKLNRRSRTRRHSLLSGAILAQPGDLIVFFQADPQRKNICSYRGIIGIFKVRSYLYSSSKSLKLNFETCKNYGIYVEGDYLIHGSCPKCNTIYSSLKECQNGHPIPTKKGYPKSDLIPEYILNLRLDLEPFIVFKYPIPDETVYASFHNTVHCEANTIIWTGRHDNAMGKGKGSSVRILLPEEFIRLSDLFLEIPDQEVVEYPSIRSRKHNIAQKRVSIFNPDKTNLEEMIFLREESFFTIGEHDMLSTAVSLQIRNANSPLRKILKDILSDPSTYLEYASPEYPIGYTGVTADYIVVFRSQEPERKNERHIFIIEFKSRSNEVKKAVYQVWFYIYWVLQAFSNIPNCLKREKLIIYPIIISNSSPNNYSTVPNPTSGFIKLINGKEVEYKIHNFRLLQYMPIKSLESPIFRSPVSFKDITKSWQKKTENWKLPIGIPLRHVEKAGIRKLNSIVKSTY